MVSTGAERPSYDLRCCPAIHILDGRVSGPRATYRIVIPRYSRTFIGSWTAILKWEVRSLGLYG